MVTSVDVATPEHQPAPVGHEEKMTALVDARAAGTQAAPAATAAEPAATTDRPSWLPEKFASVEDMAKAYGELESKLGQTPKQETAASTEVPTVEAAGETGVEAAAKVVESAGIDYGQLYDEYIGSGNISDASYENLAKSGIPRAVVDAYIQGQEAVADQHRSALLSEIGGEAAYGSMVEWASTSLSPAEIAAYDKIVSGGDIEMSRMAIQGLSARYKSANPAQPNLQYGTSSPSNGQVFESWSQVTAAMKDPRYAKDEAFRAQVEARIRSSASSGKI